MAGAAYTTTVPKVLQFEDYLGNYPIKSAEIINNGDLVAPDTNGQLVVASKTAGSVVVAIGFGVMDDEHGGASSRTGVAGLTVTMSVYRKAKIGNLNSTLVPSLTKVGQAVMLGPVPTATVSNMTCAITTTNTDEVQAVGVSIDGATMEGLVSPPFLKAQTVASSTLTQG